MDIEQAKRLSRFRSEMGKARGVYMNEMAGLAMGLPDDPEALSETIRQIEERYRRKLERLKSDYKVESGELEEGEIEQLINLVRTQGS